MENLTSYFSIVPDPRAANARHDLMELLIVALVAVLCGAKSCAEMALYGHLHEKDLREFLKLEHGIPSHDTFSKVFRWLDPRAFEEAFLKFMAAFSAAMGEKKAIAIDGKAIRRACEKGKQFAPQVMVTAWGSKMRLVLGCRAAEAGGERNAALELLKLVDIKGATITADALHCHGGMAALIKARHGDYILTLKGNEPHLLREAEALVAATNGRDFAETKERSHGRYEKRRAVVVPAPRMAQKHRFPGLRAVGMITRWRDADGKKAKTVHYYVMSDVLKPDEFLQAVRSHWSIENQQHWMLDVLMDEDRSRNRRDHGAKNLAVLRRLALNILRAEKTPMPMSHKMKCADWNRAFFFKLLGHMR